MNTYKLPPGSVPCTDALWQASPLTRNSSFLKVLYLNRYHGAHLKRLASAHPYWELLAVNSGAGVLTFSQHKLTVKADTLVLCPPNWKHADSFPTRDAIWVGFGGSVMQNVTPACLSVNSPSLVKSVFQLWQLSERRFGSIGFEIDGGILSILGCFFRSHQEREQHSTADPVGIAIDWLHAHLAESIAFPRVAERAGVSEGHFYRLFKRKTGMTPTQYLNTIRMESAQRMLGSPHIRISEVAAACGFQDPLYFSRVFKRHTGQCPETFRQTHHK